jgi:uncharacterized protein YjaZ
MKKITVTIQFPKIIDATQEVILDSIVTDITANKKFILGSYSSVERFTNDLRYSIFGDDTTTPLPTLETYHEYSTHTIQETLTICSAYLPIESTINVFVLPMKNESASADLDGVNAFALGKSTLYILINPTIKNWEQSLIYTIAHEYAHLVSAHYVPFQSIRTGIVYEGLAEHFREQVFGGPHAKYSLALTKEEAMEKIPFLSDEELDRFINDDNYDFYLSYFFGGGKYPEWFGYSIGYWLVWSILEKQPLSLRELFTKQSKDVFALFKK